MWIVCAILFVGIVGFGVHVLHDKAYAQMTRSCDIWNLDGGEEIPPEGAWAVDAVVQFRREIALDVWDNWEDAWVVDCAHYFYPFEDFSYRWQVMLMPEGPYDAVNPDGQMQTFNATDPVNFRWEVQEW